MVGNGLSSSSNNTFDYEERAHTMSLGENFAVAQYLAHIYFTSKVPLKKLTRMTKDMKQAFRQLIRQRRQAKFTIICAWHPKLCAWMYAAAAVWHFIRTPTFITAVARRWLGLPITHFFDDLKDTSTDTNARTSRTLLNEVTELPGWLFGGERPVTWGIKGIVPTLFEVMTMATMNMFPKLVQHTATHCNTR